MEDLDGAGGWLEQLRSDLQAITTPAARELWPGTGGAPWFNYRWEHVLQVERDALRLLDSAGGDRDVVLAAVWIHDRFQPAFTGEGHGPRAAEWAEANLASLGFPADLVGRVAASVRDHSAAPGALGPDPPEARLIWDADKLAHLGSHEVLTQALTASARDLTAEMLADPAFARRGLIRSVWPQAIARLRTRARAPRHFYLPLSRRLARERIAAHRAFLDCLEAQLT
jgi:hypothetical protein